MPRLGETRPKQLREAVGEARDPLDALVLALVPLGVLRPVAEPVLALLGLDFAKVIGDDRQLTLF